MNELLTNLHHSFLPSSLPFREKRKTIRKEGQQEGRKDRPKEQRITGILFYVTLPRFSIRKVYGCGARTADVTDKRVSIRTMVNENNHVFETMDVNTLLDFGSSLLTLWRNFISSV